MRNAVCFFLYLKARCDDIIFQAKNERVVDHTVMAKHISFFVAEACVIIILCALVKMICLNYLLLFIIIIIIILGAGVLT
jgi:uncharacterized membrane protein YdbT with pleckstrin-like domain